MSLATRCTACGTIFRIVEDQLRVSDGWVRCGRCAEIFDARELLFDIERDAPPPWPTQFAPEAEAEPQPAPPPPAPVFEPPQPWMPPPDPEPQADALPTGWPSPDIARHEPRWVDEDAAAPAPSPTPEPAPILAAEPAPAAPAMPEFMRRAENSARWNRPGVRLALAGLTLLLALLLGLQIVLHFRHAIAALHPPLREPLRVLCGLAGCEIKPWKRIEALSIDATSLNPIGSGSYRLNLALRNKTGVDVAAPSVELSLTDANGAPLARRVLGPEAMSPALTQVNAESEQSLSLVFSTGSQRISGYSVNIFYP
ncbi:zinc-ribbon and DUF3426 domain-containing protein [Roseateles sp.]|uniref:zinc-ribbon and DUF3426 domain-containing protein n=1 Tax=Roseateles sp. TaxID=1971397 RepID=UPI0025D8C724|nr:zinc-ribbon and DUF3426 domain-containing protein [Roseateles sp.]MBV8034623.1 zinc-ribbon and DUF3426 domain-containing protein [Roseateles sp.]